MSGVIWIKNGFFSPELPVGRPRNKPRTSRVRISALTSVPRRWTGYYYYYYYYYYYLLELSFHWMAVVLTLVQTKQIRINIHKPNNKKNSTNNTKHSKNKYTLPKHPHNCQNTHTLQNPHLHTHTHTHTQTRVLRGNYTLAVMCSNSG